MRSVRRATGLFARPLLLALLVLTLGEVAQARPEKIRPGESYYSDDYVEHGLVRDLAAEKNYEEVYQFYTYYEVIYDAAERVVVFVEYRRGEVLRREEYNYGADGALSTRTVKRAGEPPEITTVPNPARKEDHE